MDMKFLGGDKFAGLMFRKADGVVWDLMTGRVGVKTDEGIATLDGEGEDAQININLMDQFSMALPAFAQSTPIGSVQLGDIIYKTGSKPSWVVDRIVKKPAARVGSTVAAKKAATKTAAVAVDPEKISFRLMSVDGSISTWNPPKVQLLGLESGVMVLRSLMSILPGGSNGLAGMQGSIAQMMQFSMMTGNDIDIEAMLPMMLMGQVNGDQGGGNNIMQAMLMAQMFKGGGSMFGGSGRANASNNGPFRG